MFHKVYVCIGPEARQLVFVLYVLWLDIMETHNEICVLRQSHENSFLELKVLSQLKLQLSLKSNSLKVQLSFNYDYDLYFVAHSSIYTTTVYGKLL